MKITIHYKSGSFLGITETWIYGQIRNLKKYKPIVYAFCAENLNIYPIKNIRTFGLCKKGCSKYFNPIYFINIICYRLFNFCPTFLYYFKKDKPSLIHAHFGPSGYSILKLKNYYKIPLITTFYGYDISMLPRQHPNWEKKYIKLFNQGERFLVEGNHMKKCLIELGCPKGKVEVFHLGVDLEKIKFTPRKIGEDEEIRILVVASFREKKGIPYAIEAFGIVKKAYPNLKLKLTLIGDSNGSSEGELEKKKILKIIEKYNLKKYIKMLGYQPYSVLIKEFYKNHIFLHPSVHASNGDTEGGAPVSIIEASASGMPILSTTHCDIPEIVINGKSGYLVSERDVKTLAEKLDFLVRHSEKWEEMGKEGKCHIEKDYDVKKQVRKLEEIYDKVLSRR